MLSHHLLLLAFLASCQGLTLVMMGARRGKGGLQQNLDDARTFSSKGVKALNGGKGQEITGVTLPAEGALVSLFGAGQTIPRTCVSLLRHGMQLFVSHTSRSIHTQAQSKDGSLVVARKLHAPTSEESCLPCKEIVRDAPLICSRVILLRTR